MTTAFRELALAEGNGRPTGLRGPAERAGLEVLLLPDRPTTGVRPAPGRAWRCPAGYVERLQQAGETMPLTAAPGSWFAELPAAALGRPVVALSAGEVATAEQPFSPVSIKLATHKLRSRPLERVTTWQQCRDWAASLPAHYGVLVAGGWLELHSEYRVYTVGRDAVACSPYVVAGESWSPLLAQSRQSFHDAAAAFVADLLAAVPDVPPAVVVDVGRLESGRLIVLETNTSWGAGLYGCDPEAVLASVLAANEPADPRWTWHP